MNLQELSDADSDLSPTRREAAKTTLITSVSAILRLFLVSAILGLVADWFLNRDVRRSLVSDNLRTIEWIEEHKKEYLTLLVAAAKDDTREVLDKVAADQMRERINELQVRLRRTETAVSVIQGTSHNHNGNHK